MKNFKFYCFLTLVWMSQFSATSQNPAQDLAQVKTKSEQLEKDIIALRQSNESLTKSLEDTKVEVKTLREDVNLYLKVLDIIGIILGVVAAVSLFQMFFWTRLQIRNQIGKVISQNKDALLKLVDLQELEAMYKAKVSVWVVNDGREMREAFRKEFGNLGFAKLEHHTGITPEKLNADLLIFNHLTIEQVNGFIEKSMPNTHFVAYNTTGVRYASHPRLNNANSAMTLDSRLMETLKFSQLKK